MLSSHTPARGQHGIVTVAQGTPKASTEGGRLGSRQAFSPTQSHAHPAVTKRPERLRVTSAGIRTVVLATLAAALVTHQLAAQEVPHTTIAAEPTGRIDKGFTHIDGFRELRDGRVLMVDLMDPALYVIDWTESRTEQVGRLGEGPREYRFPRAILPHAADSAAVVDQGNARLLILDPAGQPVYSARWTGPQGPGWLPSSADTLGNLYAEGSPRARGAGPGQVYLDSVPIERWNMFSHQRDTVAFLPINPPPSEGRPAFHPQAQWTVAPNGHLAVVFPDPYRVMWIGPDGGRRVGPVIETPVVRVTETHRERQREELRRSRPHTVRMRGGTSMWRLAPLDLPEPHWPDVLPPFLEEAVFAAPHGTLWVRRTGPAEKAPTYDVINGNGRLVGRVVLPSGRELIGLGRDAVYLVYRDGMDLQYVERYPLPRMDSADRPGSL